MFLVRNGCAPNQEVVDPHSWSQHVLCHQHCITNILSTNMKFKRIQELLFPDFLKISSHPELSSSSQGQTTETKAWQKPMRSYRSEQKVSDTHLGFITFMFSRVDLAKSLSQGSKKYLLWWKKTVFQVKWR